jgi:hypothetical protein
MKSLACIVSILMIAACSVAPEPVSELADAQIAAAQTADEVYALYLPASEERAVAMRDLAVARYGEGNYATAAAALHYGQMYASYAPLFRDLAVRIFTEARDRRIVDEALRTMGMAGIRDQELKAAVMAMPSDHFLTRRWYMQVVEETAGFVLPASVATRETLDQGTAVAGQTGRKLLVDAWAIDSAFRGEVESSDSLNRVSARRKLLKTLLDDVVATRAKLPADKALWVKKPHVILKLATTLYAVKRVLYDWSSEHRALHGGESDFKALLVGGDPVWGGVDPWQLVADVAFDLWWTLRDWQRAYADDAARVFADVDAADVLDDSMLPVSLTSELRGVYFPREGEAKPLSLNADSESGYEDYIYAWNDLYDRHFGEGGTPDQFPVMLLLASRAELYATAPVTTAHLDNFIDTELTSLVDRRLPKWVGTAEGVNGKMVGCDNVLKPCAASGLFLRAVFYPLFAATGVYSEYSFFGGKKQELVGLIRGYEMMRLPFEVQKRTGTQVIDGFLRIGVGRVDHALPGEASNWRQPKAVDYDLFAFLKSRNATVGSDQSIVRKLICSDATRFKARHGVEFSSPTALKAKFKELRAVHLARTAFSVGRLVQLQGDPQLPYNSFLSRVTRAGDALDCGSLAAEVVLGDIRDAMFSMQLIGSVEEILARKRVD